MGKFKKALACLLLSTMLISSVGISNGLATDILADTAVYKLNPLTESIEDEGLTIYQSQIDEEQWNVSLLGDVSPVVYNDFPMEISKYVDSLSKMNLTFSYLKLVDSNDSASLEIKDRNTGAIAHKVYFSDNNYRFIIENIEIGKVYNLTITENINGKEGTYEAVIETKYTTADMPSNVSLSADYEVNPNYKADKVLVTEVNNDNETVVVDENGNEVVIVGDKEGNEINVDELPEYYNTLEKNKLYQVQASVWSEGFYNNHSGFISTYEGDVDLGIYIPNYSLYLTGNYESHTRKGANRARHPMVTADEIRRNAVEYEYMDDGFFSLPYADEDYIIIKFVFPETGSYTVETLGPIATSAEYWRDYQGTITYSTVLRGNGSNFHQNISIVEGETRYYVVYFEDGSYDRSIFRIKSNDYPNDISNSTYELEMANLKTPCNTALSGEFEYPKDVDVFYIDNEIAGEYGFSVANTHGNDDMLMQIFYKPLADTLTLWAFSSERIIKPGKAVTYVHNLKDSGTRYFVQLRMKTNTSYGGEYNIEIISPTKGDQYEPNNTFTEAVDLISLDGLNGAIYDLTLHKGDIDYFSFTTGEGGSDIRIELNEVFDRIYNIDLYKETAEGPEYVISGVKQRGYNRLEVFDLDALTKYYICINNDGMGSDAYTAVGNTMLSWYIEHKDSPGDPGTIVEIGHVPVVEAFNTEWDWAACAEMVANVKLQREGKPLSSKMQFDAVLEFTVSLDVPERVSLNVAAQAARYFYNNGDTSGYSFMGSNNILVNNEAKFITLVTEGKASVMMLTSAAYPDDLSLARFIVLCGVNTADHTYKIIDPITGTTSWVSQDILNNGGYIPGSDIKYTGAIIEMQ